MNTDSTVSTPKVNPLSPEGKMAVLIFKYDESAIMVRIRSVMTDSRGRQGHPFHTQRPKSADPPTNLPHHYQTQRRALPLPSPTDGLTVYLIPVKNHAKAVAVSYFKSKASFNLSALFAFLQYRTQPGSREFHRIDFAEAPVQIDDWESPALAMSMKVEETRWNKTEAQKKKAEAEKAAKEAAQKAAPAQA